MKLSMILLFPKFSVLVMKTICHKSCHYNNVGRININNFKEFFKNNIVKLALIAKKRRKVDI